MTPTPTIADVGLRLARLIAEAAAEDATVHAEVLAALDLACDVFERQLAQAHEGEETP